MSTLQQHFGREVKVYEIQEYDKTYFRLFYYSTGTGNERFKSKFTNTLVPFYAMMDDEDQTLIKAIIIRNNVHKPRTLFRWQVDVLEHLSDKTDSDILRDTLKLIDNYFNTPGEIIISIKDRNGFWKNNTNIADEILEFFQKYEFSNKEIKDFDINIDTNELHNIDKSILKNNWRESNVIVQEKEHKDRIDEKSAAAKSAAAKSAAAKSAAAKSAPAKSAPAKSAPAKRAAAKSGPATKSAPATKNKPKNKPKKGGKKTKRKCQNGGKKTKRKSKKNVKGKKTPKMFAFYN